MMGATQGRLISATEARKRFSPVEIRALQSGFERLSRSSPQHGYGEIGLVFFKTLVLADFPDLPELLANRIFFVFDINRSVSLDWLEFICGLCLLCRSKLEERLRFLFRIYDDDNNGALARSTLLRYADLLDDPRLSDEERRSSYDLIDEIFRLSKDKSVVLSNEISIETFSKTMVRYMNAPLLSWPTHIGQKLLDPMFRAGLTINPSPLPSPVSTGLSKSVPNTPRALSSPDSNESEALPYYPLPPTTPLGTATAAFTKLRFQEPTAERFTSPIASTAAANAAAPLNGRAHMLKHHSSRGQVLEGSTFKRLHKLPIRDLLTPGESWYVLSAKWFRAWEAYSGYHGGRVDYMSLQSWQQVQRPGPIDNRDVIRSLRPEDDVANVADLGSLDLCSIRPEISYPHDFIVLCQEAWNFLHDIYGGGPLIERRVIPGEFSGQKPEIELFPVTLDVRCVKFSSEFVPVESKVPGESIEAHYASVFRSSTDQTSFASSCDGDNDNRNDDFEDDDFPGGPARIQVSRRSTVRDLERAILDRVLEPRARTNSTESFFSTLSSQEDGVARKAAAIQNRDRFSAERMRLWCVLDDNSDPIGEVFSGSPSKTHGSHYRNSNVNVKLLQDPKETVEEADLEDGQTILLELSSADGNWPLASIETLRSLQPRDAKAQCSKSSNGRVVMLGGGPSPHDTGAMWRTRSSSNNGTGSYLSSSPTKSSHTTTGPNDRKGPLSIVTRTSSIGDETFAQNAHQETQHVLGNVGMANLGNTCFMSASLQCLIHTELLKQYILDDAYIADVNTSIHDSTHGLLADSFADIVRTAWGANGRIPGSIAPRRFKRELSKHDTRFMGVQQQDAQELLSSLLDGLAQDLNRVRSKAYVELKDSDGRADEEVAREWWIAHLRRELSIITALFSGQFKTLLRCDTCGYESARFEPFSVLSLPLPDSPMRTVNVHVVFADGARPPLLVALRVEKSGTFGDVRDAIINLQPGVNGSVVRSPANESDEHEAREERSLESDRLVLAYVFERQIYSIIEDDRLLETLRAQDPLYAFEIPVLENDVGCFGKGANKKQSSLNRSKVDDDDSSDGEERVDGATTNVPGEVPQEDTTGCSIYIGSRVAYCSNSDHAAEPMLGIVVGTKTANRRSSKLNQNAHEIIYEVRFNTNSYDASETRTVFLARSELNPAPMQPCLLKIEQRIWHRHACYFVNPMRSVNVGMPFVLMVCPDQLSGYALYEAISRQVSGTKFASDAKETVEDQLVAMSLDNESTYRSDNSRSKDITDEKIRARWGFTVILLGRKGKSCGCCSWMEACDGCPVQPNETPVSLTASGPCTIAVDWGNGGSVTYRNSTSTSLTMTIIDKHSSVEDARREEQKRMPLSSLLESFTEQEKLVDADQARCARCKEFHDHTMKLGVWRAPPVLVIHLKRFDRSRKLLNLVDYPTRDLDLSPYLAQAMPPQPQKSMKAMIRKERREIRKKRIFPGSRGNTEAFEQDGDDDEDNIEEVEPEDVTSECCATVSSPHSSQYKFDQLSNYDTSTSPDVSSATAKSPEELAKVEAESEALHLVENLVDSDYVGLKAYGGHEHGGIPPEYDLYGVVEHIGSLGGGHYIAKAKSSVSGKWYNFDDRIISPIDEEDAVDAGAYLLFYVRKDIAAEADVNALFPCKTPDSKTVKEARKALGHQTTTMSDRCSVM